ncbi:MAG: exonuclease domain-containing protein [Rudaea sp.]
MFLDLPISQVPLVFVDTETTGLSPRYGDRVVEIALARFRGGVMEDYYVTLVNPFRRIPFSAQRIHGIGDGDVRDAPAFAQVADQVCAGLNDAVLVGHNAPFDLGFIANEFALAGRPCPANLVLDTLTFLRRYFRFPSNSLPRVAEQLGIVPERSHRALADALTTHAVLGFIAAELERRGAKTLGDLLDLQGGSIPWEPASEPHVPLPPALEEALRHNLKLFVRYVDGDGVPSERWISPIGLRVIRETVYLRAYCHLRDAERYFRLDRVLELRLEQ